MEEWKKIYLELQNGSDIRGIALDGIKGENINLTEEMVQNISSAFVDFLADRNGVTNKPLRIGVGNDSRLSAKELKTGAVNGIIRRGGRAYDCGLAPTPSMFMSTILEGFEYDGAVMITASHLPSNRNGLKFFTKEGGLESRDIRRILEMAAVISRMGYEKEFCKAEEADLAEAYTKYLQNVICSEVCAKEYEKPLSGLHIVIDASNGVGGYFKNVLEPLGASTRGSICMNPDGTFPNHVPNPENEQAMEALKGAVLKAKADLGVIFDTDGDRAAVVFSDGEEVNRNAIIALMSAILSEQYPKTTIVTDSVTSSHLTKFLEVDLGMRHHRFKRGYKNVINEAIRLNEEGVETHLAIETSGHGAVKENYFLDDGAYLSIRIISYLAKCRKKGRRLEELIAGLKRPEESKEYRLRILETDYKKYGQDVLEAFHAFAEKEPGFSIVKPNHEGIRIDFSDNEVKGWMLMRMSLHDPVIPLNIESDEKNGVEIILKRIRPFLDLYPMLTMG